MGIDRVEVGAIVTLLSGGPPMTVTKTEGRTKELRCTWFDARDQVKEAWFPARSIKPILTPEKT